MNKQENYDFNYVKDHNSTDHKAVIEHKKEKPENIYKFYAVSRFNVDALIKGYFYAS